MYGNVLLNKCYFSRKIFFYYQYIWFYINKSNKGLNNFPIIINLNYRLPSSSDVPNVSGGGFFSWGTKFRYSGRVEREILEDMSITRESPSVTRVGSLRRKSSSEPPTPSNMVINQVG